MVGAEFSDALAKLYLATTDGSQWTTALNAIEDHTGSVGAVIDFIPKETGSAPVTIAGRFTAEQCALYAQNYQPICRRIAYGMSHPELSLHYDGLFICEAEMDVDPVYDWLASHGLRYYIGGSLADTDRHHLYFSLQRSPKQGHVQRADIQLFAHVCRHVSVAAQIASRLGTLEAHRQFSLAILESLPQAIFALGDNGQILLANSSGEGLLQEGDGFRNSRTLSARHPEDQLALDRTIRSAAFPMTGFAGGWVRLSRASGRLPYAVFIAPLVTEDEGLARTQARVLAVVHDPMARLGPSTEMLSIVYGLTPSEAGLARALACGHDLASASAMLGTALGTSRAHLKPIFRKLGVNRQAELVRLLSGFPRVEQLAISRR